MRSRTSGDTPRHVVVLCGVIPVFLAAILAVYRPGILPRLDDTVYDTVMRSARTTPPGNRVVIVDVDERSLATIGQWPWRRDVVGKTMPKDATLSNDQITRFVRWIDCSNCCNDEYGKLARFLA